ncbi:hypothetical protein CAUPRSCDRAFT_12541 [Caulochytrium protostelioides]|nr:hypothetical protein CAUPRSCDRAFT_12541 [Caulochytrium protostelioides]
MNHFVEPLSLKAMLFGLLLVVSALVMPVHALRAVGIWPAFGSRATHRHAVDQPAGPASPPPPRPPALAQARRRWPPPPLPPPPPRRALEPAPPTTMRYDDGARWHPDAPARLAGSDAAARHLRGAPAYLTHSWD